MRVFYNSRFKRRTWTKKAVKAEEPRQQCRVLLIKTQRRLTSIAALTVHAETSLLYTFQRSRQANRNINLWQEKAPVNRLSRGKAPKTQQICHYRHARKTSGTFFIVQHGRRL